MRRMLAARRWPPGFTLLEVLLAIAIGVLVMAAVYSAMGVHLRFVNAGRDDVERGQLARAILGKIAQDLRSVVFVPEPPPDEQPAPEDELSGSGGDAAEEPVAEEDLFEDLFTDLGASVPSGMYGDAQSLVLYVGRIPRGDAASFAGAEGGADVGGFARVEYYLLPANAVGETPGGLVRLEGEAITPHASDDADSLGESLPPGAEVIAPEVTHLEFRYWDGRAWAETWDSAVSRTLPRAVEIRIALASEQEGDAAAFAATTLDEAAALGLPVHRLVVVMPLGAEAQDADPLLGELGL